MEQHKIQDGIQTQIQSLEMIYMEQHIKMETHHQVIHFIHGGGSLRLLLILAIACALLMAPILICTITTLITVATGFRCLPVLRCSV